MHYRPATQLDAAEIASIHARSWQLHYRGAMDDHYLDREAPAERAHFWKTRLADQADRIQTIVAHDEHRLTGFCCLEPDVQPEDGYYLDNLHVIPEAKGRGIGKTLMRKSAELLLKTRPDGKIYLWVLTNNTDAIAFYDHLGGRRGRKKTITLAGNQVEVLMMWWPLSEMADWE